MEDKLRAFYHRYNREKMEEIPGLIEKFKGREDAMFDVLQKKYYQKGDEVWGGITSDDKGTEEGGAGAAGAEEKAEL